jgi:hypothetical protein
MGKNKKKGKDDKKHKKKWEGKQGEEEKKEEEDKATVCPAVDFPLRQNWTGTFCRGILFSSCTELFIIILLAASSRWTA